MSTGVEEQGGLMNNPAAGPPDQKPTWAGRLLQPSLLRDYGIVLSFLGVFFYFAITEEAFLSWENLQNVAFQNAPVGIAACATTIAIITGGFDLSLGAVYALAGVVAAWLAMHVDPAIAAILGMALGAVVGFGNGILVTVFRVNSFLATLASSLIVRGIAVLVSGGFLIQVSDPSFRFVGSQSVVGIKVAILVFAAFALLSGLLLARSVFGRYAYAVGGNEQAARLSGVPIAWVRIAAFSISGLGAGIAGVLAASRIGQGQANVGVGLELTAIAAVVVGGTSIMGGFGAVWRTVLGVMFLALITNGFNIAGIDPVYKDIFTGAIIIAAVTLNSFSRNR